MAKRTEAAIDRALHSLLHLDDHSAGEVFRSEPQINELEVIIDELIVERLRRGDVAEGEVRFLVASVKVNKDLERMGDLAVNIAQRTISLVQREKTEAKVDTTVLQPMAIAVAHTCRVALRALIRGDVILAQAVLESDDLIDRHRDHVMQGLRQRLDREHRVGVADLDLLLASRSMERLGDLATNIAEDVIFWIRGLDVRHGRAEHLLRARKQA
jgi:phosphate transport system protein